MKRILLMAALLAAGPVCASDYRFEVDGSYQELSPDFFGTIRTRSGDVRFHPVPVKTMGVPFAEAAFLGRSSSVHIGYGKTDVDDFPNAGSENREASADIYFRDFFFSPRYDHFEYSSGAASKSYRLAAGMFVTDGLLLFVSAREDERSDFKEKQLGFKYVNNLGNGTARNIEGSLTLGSASGYGDYRHRIYDFRADYYFSAAVSLGAQFQRLTIEGGSSYFDIDEKIADFTVRARWFIVPAVSAEASYGSGADGNADIIGGKLTVRF